MKKILLGIAAVFALSTLPTIARAEDAPKADGDKAPKKHKGKKKGAEGEKKDDAAPAPAK